MSNEPESFETDIFGARAEEELDAEAIREYLVIAEGLRKTSADPGDVYLEGKLRERRLLQVITSGFAEVLDGLNGPADLLRESEQDPSTAA